MLVTDFIGAAILGFDPGGTWISVATISKQPELVLGNSKSGKQLFGFHKIGSTSANQRQAVTKQSTNPTVVTCQVIDGRDVARLRNESKRFAPRQDRFKIDQGGGRTITRSCALENLRSVETELPLAAKRTLSMHQHGARI